MRARANSAPVAALLGVIGLVGAVAMPSLVVAEGTVSGQGAVQIPPGIPVRRAHDAAEIAPGRGQALAVTLVLGAALLVGVGAVKRRKGSLRWSTGVVARWFRAQDGDGAVRCLHSLRLTPRASVHCVRWSGREFLVGCADGAVSVIGERAVVEGTNPETAEKPLGGHQ